MIPPMRCLVVILSLTLAAPAFAGSEPSRLTEAARDQVGQTVTYDPAYVALEFPGGDIPRDRSNGRSDSRTAQRRQHATLIHDNVMHV